MIWILIFKRAFNIDYIDSVHVAKAIAQFERTLVSANSRYDKYIRGEVILTDEEFDGLNIFFTESFRLDRINVMRF